MSGKTWKVRTLGITVSAISVFRIRSCNPRPANRPGRPVETRLTDFVGTPSPPETALPAESSALDPLRVEARIHRPLPDEVQTERVLQLQLLVEAENPLAVAELALEVLLHVVGELGRDEPLAFVVPIRVDPHQEVGLLPVDGVAVDVALAG